MSEVIYYKFNSSNVWKYFKQANLITIADLESHINKTSYSIECNHENKSKVCSCLFSLKFFDSVTEKEIKNRNQPIAKSSQIIVKRLPKNLKFIRPVKKSILLKEQMDIINNKQRILDKENRDKQKEIEIMNEEEFDKIKDNRKKEEWSSIMKEYQLEVEKIKKSMFENNRLKNKEKNCRKNKDSDISKEGKEKIEVIDIIDSDSADFNGDSKMRDKKYNNRKPLSKTEKLSIIKVITKKKKKKKITIELDRSPSPPKFLKKRFRIR